jgi:hypothetical protein
MAGPCSIIDHPSQFGSRDNCGGSEWNWLPGKRLGEFGKK